MKITPSVFEAYLKCPTKCWLRATREAASGNTYAEWVQAQNAAYRETGTARLLAGSPQDEVSLSPDMENVKAATWRLASSLTVQAEMDSCALESELHAVERVPAAGRGKAAHFIPIRFVFTNKLGKDDKLLLALDAVALSKVLKREVSLGKIIHGDTHATLKVKTSALAGEVRKRLEKIAALLANPAPPDLVLNRHCGECEFQARCRKIAIEKDDLSLLSRMSEQERKKLRSKGIFTVTQLSYTFRPRRRPRKLRDKREKYHHSLKALAIREKKIHIVGSPQFKIEGTPVYLDVEGLPDRDFYYLIGLRIGHGESAVQHSLWADTVADEGKIWRQFLALLGTVEKPVLIHYGSYETSFSKQMAERHGAPQTQSVAANTIASAINLVSVMFAQIYFPGFSNGLKNVVGSLGHNWSAEISSGLESIICRYRWEQSFDDAAKKVLVSYNAQDCEALNIAVEKVLELVNFTEPSKNRQSQNTDFVRADIAKRSDDFKWGDFKSPVPGFETINAAARWNYQRQRIYARNGQPRKKRKGGSRLSIKTEDSRIDQIVIWPVSRSCPNCKYPIRRKGILKIRTVQELIFGRHSLKRRRVRYCFRTYRCQKCQVVYGFDDRFAISYRYGWNLLAYFLYHVIEFAIPQRAVVGMFNGLFGFEIGRSALHHLKSKSASYYADTKEAILKSIVEGTLVHADETRANIKGTDGFVWVLTNMREVFYFLADSREAEVIHKLLPAFKGVLVSDFYAAYDSIDCPQQRCLIHLMRDLNEEVLKNPFDEQLKQIVTSFADLLKPMVETVDVRGLKKYFLHKHLKSVECFYRVLDEAHYQSEAALKCKERFQRNRDKLFTFLAYDDVPWNNNNAEHAIKAFARLRDVIEGSSTEKGLREYLILLSICQTCKYMRVSFLDFLRSGEKDIHAFAESRQGRRRPSSNEPTALSGEESAQN